MRIYKSLAALAILGTAIFVLFQNCSNSKSNETSTNSSFDGTELILSQAPINVTSATIERDSNRLLLSSFSMRPNQEVVFEDLMLAFQGDGNLVLYQRHPQFGMLVLWTAEVQRNCNVGNCEMVFDNQFGLRLTDNGTVYWQSINSRISGLRLELARRAPFISLKGPDRKHLWSGLSRLNWLSFIDPIAGVYGGGRDGVTDYRALLSEASRGDLTFRKIHVIKVYQQFIQISSDAELRAFFRFLDERNIALAMEYGPVELTPSEFSRCGQGIEGAQPAGAATFLARRIRENGGRLSFIAMDEPIFYSHYPSPSGHRPPFVSCELSIDDLARRTAQTYLNFAAEFPDVIYGDTEPFFAIPIGSDPQEWSRKYFDYIERFERYAGSSLGFVHDDTSMNTRWEQIVGSLQTELNRRQIAYGMIWNGSSAARDSINWVAEAVSKVQKYKAMGLRRPDQNIFQSWDIYPNRVLSDAYPGSLLFLGNYYFSQLSPLVSSRVTIPVYRFYSSSRGDHDYNIGTNPLPGFSLEGEAFRVFRDNFPSAIGLYRCRVPSNDRTYLSISSDCEGMQFLAQIGFVSGSLNRETHSPLYRCFNTIHGRHFVTKNSIECASNGWTVEGPIGFIN